MVGRLLQIYAAFFEAPDTIHSWGQLFGKTDTFYINFTHLCRKEHPSLTTRPAQCYIAIFKFGLPLDHKMMPWKFGVISNGSGVNHVDKQMVTHIHYRKQYVRRWYTVIQVWLSLSITVDVIADSVIVIVTKKHFNVLHNTFYVKFCSSRCCVVFCWKYFVFCYF